jgi:hypothetical protein
MSGLKTERVLRAIYRPGTAGCQPAWGNSGDFLSSKSCMLRRIVARQLGRSFDVTPC